MTKIKFPERLENLLKDSPMFAPIRAYADRAGEILADNKLPFFPDYTDHGTDHINQVMESEVDLVPEAVWNGSTKDSRPRLLCDVDATVIIGATLLHDIAMHLRPTGFLELVNKETRFQPLSWFMDNQEGHKADRPWYDLWLDFQREARRFSDRDLGNIIGLESVRQGWKFEKLSENPSQWERNHNLIIGEFIRRHHARLAHEIAVYGFPGLKAGSNDGQFPALGASGDRLQTLADLIGLVARSHGLSLRLCQAYLDARPHYAHNPKPMGCAVLYPMALLRVADYLQIDRQRTPTALLKLRNPQSPVSVQEWNKHLAVQYIGPAKDPRGKTITVSPDISQAVYLQLRDLLAGLQAEMDHATAVLDETYGARRDLGLDQLKLAIRRVHSNLNNPAFRDALPYVPERTAFAADPNLLTLLVEPLYGKEPGVGVRELMQNAVDAVCELHAWCENHGEEVESLDLPEQDSDVQIDFIQREDETWFLRVTDKGIGMTSETIQNYFLRAGASFRQSADWAKEFLDEQGKPRVLRAGRFGVGAFAVFLLGPNFRLRTRHVGTAKNGGYAVDASSDSELIEIRRIKDNLPVGTTIEVDISSESATKLGLERDRLYGIEETDWFCWNWPIVNRRIISGATEKLLAQKHTALLHKTALSPEWSTIYPQGFNAVHWTFADYPELMCNGIKIAVPKGQQKLYDYHDRADINWSRETQLGQPNISALDNNANLPLTTQRYSLSDKNLPFIAELSRDVTLSFIAHALVCGPTSRAESHMPGRQLKPHPLVLHQEEGENGFLNSLLRWCSSSRAVIPADPWLYSLLQTNTCLVFGRVNLGCLSKVKWLDAFIQSHEQSHEHCSILSWNGYFEYNGEEDKSENLTSLAQHFCELAINGFQALNQEFSDMQMLVSAHQEMELSSELENVIKWFGYDDQSINYHEITHSNAQRQNLLFKTGTLIDPLPLDQLIETMDREKTDDLFYFAEVQTKPNNNPKPESLLAKIWNECLGPQPIPFDPEARRALIEHGRQHPELKRHIEAWEEMKRTGSKWVVGDAKQ